MFRNGTIGIVVPGDMSMNSNCSVYFFHNPDVDTANETFEGKGDVS